MKKLLIVPISLLIIGIVFSLSKWIIENNEKIEMLTKSNQDFKRQLEYQIDEVDSRDRIQNIETALDSTKDHVKILQDRVIDIEEKTNRDQKESGLETTLYTLARKSQNMNIDYNYQKNTFRYPKKKFRVKIPINATLRTLSDSVYKDLNVFESKLNMGGIKVMYDISSELNGLQNSDQIQAGSEMIFYSIGSMGFELIDVSANPKNIISRMMKQEIEFIRGKVK